MEHVHELVSIVIGRLLSITFNEMLYFDKICLFSSVAVYKCCDCGDDNGVNDQGLTKQKVDRNSSELLHIM